MNLDQDNTFAILRCESGGYISWSSWRINEKQSNFYIGIKDTWYEALIEVEDTIASLAQLNSDLQSLIIHKVSCLDYQPMYGYFSMNIKIDHLGNFLITGEASKSLMTDTEIKFQFNTREADLNRFKSQIQETLAIN